ncbi:hypothetical protein GTS_08800 [Gandjariella thermophila]|uniref:Uncharacterized protein n=1 Tax=Gandjariella thermophila TaxID=1931992 RepID=A0A4D4J5I5_9PSEU|nr:hypothetical protein GTS_08800 [Gandjariella thermophila]
MSGSAVASLTSLAAREGVGAASGVATAAQARAAGRVLPVPAELAGLLPWGGLRRGSTVPVRGSTSLLLALLATATAEGSWAAVVGVPDLGLLAAREFGVAVHRLALVPRPGAEFPSVVAALLDGVDLVAAAPPGNAALPERGVPAGEGGPAEAVRPLSPISAERRDAAGSGAGGAFDSRMARRLSARARQRGAVLLPLGPWPAPDVELICTDGRWSGMGAGHGFLRRRRVRVLSRGRGVAARPRRADVLLPAEGGALGPAEAGILGATEVSTVDAEHQSRVDGQIHRAVSAATRDLVAAGMLVEGPDGDATRLRATHADRPAPARPRSIARELAGRTA